VPPKQGCPCTRLNYATTQKTTITEWWSVQKRNQTLSLRHLLISLQLYGLVSFKILPSTIYTPLPGFPPQLWNVFVVMLRSSSEFSSPLSSEISDLPEWILALGTKRIMQGPDLESRAVGGWQSSHASSKIHGWGATREQVHCHINLQRVQETGSLYCMYLITNWRGVFEQMWG
jgi:hypothetical protein